MVGFYRRFLRVGADMPSHLTITKNSCRVSATQPHQLLSWLQRAGALSGDYCL